MLKLSWNTAKLGNLKCGAESSTNTEAIVDFSPLLKNMSKHGHCAAKISVLFFKKIVYYFLIVTKPNVVTFYFLASFMSAYFLI